MNELDQLRCQLAAAQARCGELVQICHEHGAYVDIKISTGALDAAIAAALREERIATAVRLDQQLAKAIAAATKPLVDALEKAADTFADLKLGLRLLGNPDVARACEIAEEETRKVIPK